MSAAALEAQQKRVNQMFKFGAMSEDDWRSECREIAAQRERLMERKTGLYVPNVETTRLVRDDRGWLPAGGLTLLSESNTVLRGDHRPKTAKARTELRQCVDSRVERSG